MVLSISDVRSAGASLVDDKKINKEGYRVVTLSETGSNTKPQYDISVVTEMSRRWHVKISEEIYLFFPLWGGRS